MPSQSKLATVMTLVANTIRLKQVAKILGAPIGDETKDFSRITKIFADFLDDELENAMVAKLCGLNKDLNVSVEHASIGMWHETYMDYEFILKGNFPGEVKLNFRLNTIPDDIHFHLDTAAIMEDGETVVSDNQIPESQITSVPLVFPMAVRMMIDELIK